MPKTQYVLSCNETETISGESNSPILCKTDDAVFEEITNWVNEEFGEELDESDCEDLGAGVGDLEVGEVYSQVCEVDDDTEVVFTIIRVS